MKRILYFALTALLALAAVSCKKVDTSGSKVLVQAISMDDKFSIALDASTGYLKVSITPKEASLSKTCKVKCEPEGIIECALMDKEIAIDPKAIGSTTLTVSAKTNANIKAECIVKVTDHPVEPVSVAVVKTDSHFVDGALCLAEGETFQLEAKVKNEEGAVTSDFPLEWTVIEGAGDIELNAETGTVKATATSATAKVRVTVSGYAALSDEVIVKILSLPTGIYDFYLSPNHYTFNPDNELLVKKGDIIQFTVSFKPSDSIQAYELEVTPGDNNILSVTRDGKKVMLEGLESSKDPVTVTIRSLYDKNIKKQFKVYVFDYGRFDVKEGDWVYCDGTNFRYQDCGLRFAGIPNIYVDKDGRRSSSPKAFQETLEDGFKYVGVVVSTVLPRDVDFMGCSWLYYCRNGASATELYEYRNLRKQDFRGFSNATSAHALVVGKDQLTAQDPWSEKTEMIVKTTDKKDGLYQFQLVNTETPKRFAFCENEADYMTKYLADYYEGQGWSDQPPVYTWCESGVISYLLLRFYSKHVNNTEFRVVPALLVNLFTGVPSIDTGYTTGWFLPGKYEWEKTGFTLTAVNASLQKSGAPLLSGNYWSTEELNTDNAYRYNVSSTSGVKSSVVAKDKDKAYTRAFLYL